MSIPNPHEHSIYRLDHILPQFNIPYFHLTFDLNLEKTHVKTEFKIEVLDANQLPLEVRLHGANDILSMVRIWMLRNISLIIMMS